VKLELAGYAPDIDPVTPGIFTTCVSVIPTIKGFTGAPSAAATTITGALAAACRGAYVGVKLDNTARVFAGTATKVYESVASVWTDRTRAAGGDYALGSQQRWRFTQFGDATIACGSTAAGDLLQVSSSGAFANITGSPRAEIVETVGQFVFAFSTAEATFGVSPDRWWCSGIGDHTNWTPSIAAQSATGRLTSSPGPIRAGKRFGDQIVVYKDKASYIGSYVGTPEIWQFRELPGSVGALCNEAVANIGTDALPRHFIMALDDFYIFDGSRTEPIGLPVKQTVFGSLNRSFATSAQLLHDPVNALIYCYYPVSGTTNPDKCVVYNYRTNKWGRDDRTIEAAIEYVPTGIAYQDLGTYYSTYGSLPSSSYGTTFLASAASVPGIFNTSHVIQTLTGASTSTSFTTGDYGDDRGFTNISSIRPRFLTAPSSVDMTNYYRANLGQSLTTDQNASATPQTGETGLYFLRESRWHRFQFTFSGNWESAIFDVDATQGGAY
jgi:hypothetical protein